jgi:exodeoxyribonuclease-1
MGSSILWYDLETFGIDPKHDRIAQFACVRTDEKLEEIGESQKLYCKPSRDYLPSPAACMVHGISPQTAFELGLDEYDFARRLLEEFSRPGTTAVGYNSINFDEEFIRHLLYRNLFDPYSREYAQGNSRWDIINLLRAAHDLKPEGIVWPRDEDGRPLFKLEALSKANGLDHSSAHDALSDIRATIDLARLVRSRQRRLYDWYFSHRKRESLKPLINLSARRMLLHTSAEYSSPKGCSTLIAPVGIDPANRNQLIAIDLRFDPGELVLLSAEEIRARVFTKAGESDKPRVPLSRIRLNHCPFLAPLSVLSEEAETRLGLDRKLCAERLAFIGSSPGLVDTLMKVFDEPMPPPPSDEPELSLYSGGFIPETDRAKLERFHADLAERGKSLEGLMELKRSLFAAKFKDDRILRLAGRLFARNFPETLSESERLKWRDFCMARIQFPSSEGAAELADYRRLEETVLADPDAPAPRRAMAHALLEWGKTLEAPMVLSN